MFTSHGHHVPGTLLDKSVPSYHARCGGPGLCNVCSIEVSRFQLFQENADSSIDYPEDFWVTDETRHNADTLNKVREALVQAVGMSAAHECIRNLQNSGILFRENL